MPQSLNAMHMHLVFSTKNRAPLLNEQERPRVHAYMAEMLRNMGCEDPCIGGIEDHVHSLCGLPRTISIADLVMTLKKDSSKFVKTLHGSLREFHWQSGYAVFSVSEDHRIKTRVYIQNQEEHHRTESFQDEYRRLLSDAGVAFDERYMWD